MLKGGANAHGPPEKGRPLLVAERPVRALLAVPILGLEEGALFQEKGRCGAEYSGGGEAVVRPDDGARE